MLLSGTYVSQEWLFLPNPALNALVLAKLTGQLPQSQQKDPFYA